ncbi:MAG: hypothetical protein QXI52_02270 [Nitrososphaerota archaeon]
MTLAKQQYNTHIEREMASILMDIKRLKPPVPLEVADLTNLARLTLTRPDTQTLFWMFKHRESWILGSLFSIPYWRGNLPIFSYVRLPRNEGASAYVAYTNIGTEESFLTNSNDDPKYLYGAIVEAATPPRFLEEALRRKKSGKIVRPILTRAKDITALVRLLLIMTDSVGAPPIWKFKHMDGYILGVLAPFYDYYEANALPVFIYVKEEEEPPGGFLRYITANGKEDISFTNYITDMKYFYARIINLVDVPPWLRPSRRAASPH